MELRVYNVITVYRDLNKKFKTVLNKNLTEEEAKNYIRISIKNDGFGVMMSRVNPSCWTAFHKVTKKIVNDYIETMESKDFQKILKIYDRLEQIGLKVGINF